MSTGVLALEVDGDPAGLLDDPLPLRVRGAAAGEALVWRARYRDDDARVWRATGATPAELLATGFRPAKPGPGAPAVAALASLRPVDVDLRVEAPDGRSAARTLTRRLTADGVRIRRWRDGVTATLALPAPEGSDPSRTPQVPQVPGTPTVVVDATGAEAAGWVAVAAALLASRGVVVLTVRAGLDAAVERLAAVPRAAAAPVVLAADALPVPAGVGTGEAGDVAAWDALLARIGARARG